MRWQGCDPTGFPAGGACNCGTGRRRRWLRHASLLPTTAVVFACVLFSCSTARGNGTTRGGSTKKTERGGSLVRRAPAPAAGTQGRQQQQRQQKPRSDPDQQYFNATGYPFPLGPFLNRPTIRKELVKGAIWGFEQPQSLGGSNVTANIRMTVVRLQSGGLWVHAPIAPTREQAGWPGGWRPARAASMQRQLPLVGPCSALSRLAAWPFSARLASRPLTIAS